jgi:hypothetical protein
MRTIQDDGQMMKTPMIIRCMDIETTGLDASTHAIVEIAAIDVRRRWYPAAGAVTTLPRAGHKLGRRPPRCGLVATPTAPT